MVEVYARERSLIRAGEIVGCSHNTILEAVRGAGVSVRPAGGKRGPRGSSRRGSGRRRTSSGYIIWWFWWWEGDERRTQEVLEHRVLTEKALGRPLDSSEEIHHRNGVRDDNRLQNLERRVRPHGSGATHCPHCGERI